MRAGTAAAIIDQQQNQATWNLLGTFTLDPAAGHKVVLSDEATAGLNVVADAIRYVRMGDALTVQADAVRFVPNNAESLLYEHADRLGTAQRITDQAGAMADCAVRLDLPTSQPRPEHGKPPRQDALTLRLRRAPIHRGANADRVARRNIGGIDRAAGDQQRQGQQG